MKTTIRIWALMLAVVAASGAPAAPAAPAVSQVPQFKDYPATGRYAGKNHPLVMTQKDRQFRTRLGETATAKPNFAGHYILGAWSCGAQCMMGAAIDANTGKVIWLPETVCCWGPDVDDAFDPIEARVDSRLLVLSGVRGQRIDDDGAHFYELRDGKFVYVKSIPKPASPKG